MVDLMVEMMVNQLAEKKVLMKVVQLDTMMVEMMVNQLAEKKVLMKAERLVAVMVDLMVVLKDL